MPRSARSKSPPPRTKRGSASGGADESRRSCLEELATLSTERDFFDTLPPLMEKHGKDHVKEAMQQLFNPKQVKECFEEIEARAKRLAWVEWIFGGVRGDELRDMAVVVTDMSLNEIERWEPGSRIHTDHLSSLDAEAAGFIAAHSTPRTCRLAGVDISRRFHRLARAMPMLAAVLGPQPPLDLARGGVAGYAEAVGLAVLEGEPGHTVDDFEAALRRGDYPSRAAARTICNAIDHVEDTIVALGWARQYLIAPPAAARYVVAGLNCFAVFLVGVTVMRIGATAFY